MTRRRIIYESRRIIVESRPIMYAAIYTTRERRRIIYAS